MLNAIDFGVPQTRSRVFLAALRRGETGPLKWPTAMQGQSPTVADAIGDLMGANNWRGHPQWIKRAAMPAPTIIGGSERHGGTDLGPLYTRRKWAQLGIDGLGIAEKPPDRDFEGMPQLTIPMVARLQTFPDNWQFIGSKPQVYRQLGNALPVKFAYCIAGAVMRCLVEQNSSLSYQKGKCGVVFPVRSSHMSSSKSVTLRQQSLFDPEIGAFALNIPDINGDDSELRESLKQFGWVKEFPALADENGVVLVGHRRLKIAEEEKIEPVIKKLRLGKGDAADAKRLRLALVSNIGFKAMTAKDRGRIAEHLYGERKWTMARIAEALNVNEATVSRDLRNSCMRQELKHTKTVSNPKGAGRPKGSRSRKKPDPAPEAKEPPVEPVSPPITPSAGAEAEQCEPEHEAVTEPPPDAEEDPAGADAKASSISPKSAADDLLQELIPPLAPMHTASGEPQITTPNNPPLVVLRQLLTEAMQHLLAASPIINRTDSWPSNVPGTQIREFKKIIDTAYDGLSKVRDYVTVSSDATK
jgi:hypothetical protein